MTKCVIAATKIQTIFRTNSFSDKDIRQLENLSGQRRISLLPQLFKAKNIVAGGIKYYSDMDVMVNGPNNNLWFSRVLFLFGHVIGTTSKFLQAVYAKIQWYDTYEPILNSSIQQFTYNIARCLPDCNIISFSSFVCPVLIKPLGSISYKQIIPTNPVKVIDEGTFIPKTNNVQDFDLIVDTCYYVKKNYEFDVE